MQSCLTRIVEKVCIKAWVDNRLLSFLVKQPKVADLSHSIRRKIDCLDENPSNSRNVFLVLKKPLVEFALSNVAVVTGYVAMTPISSFNGWRRRSRSTSVR